MYLLSYLFLRGEYKLINKEVDIMVRHNRVYGECSYRGMMLERITKDLIDRLSVKDIAEKHNLTQRYAQDLVNEARRRVC